MNRRVKRIQAVLFDFDDTLVDWSKRTKSWDELSRVRVGNIHDYLTAAGHKLPDKTAFHQKYVATVQASWDRANQTWEGVCFANVLGDTFAKMNLDVSQMDLDAVMRAYDWRPIPGVAPYDDTIQVLEQVRRQGYKTGLITNAMLPMWMRDVELRHYQMLDYFDARLTSGDVGYIKPHPAIYQKALELLETKPEQAIFIGDRPAYDIAGANNAGLISVWMNPQHLNHELNGVRPDYTISCLSELLPILAQLD